MILRQLCFDGPTHPQSLTNLYMKYSVIIAMLQHKTYLHIVYCLKNYSYWQASQWIHSSHFYWHTGKRHSHAYSWSNSLSNLGETYAMSDKHNIQGGAEPTDTFQMVIDNIWKQGKISETVYKYVQVCHLLPTDYKLIFWKLHQADGLCLHQYIVSSVSGSCHTHASVGRHQ